MKLVDKINEVFASVEKLDLKYRPVSSSSSKGTEVLEANLIISRDVQKNLKELAKIIEKEEPLLNKYGFSFDVDYNNHNGVCSITSKLHPRSICIYLRLPHEVFISVKYSNKNTGRNALELINITLEAFEKMDEDIKRNIEYYNQEVKFCEYNDNR